MLRLARVVDHCVTYAALMIRVICWEMLASINVDGALLNRSLHLALYNGYIDYLVKLSDTVKRSIGLCNARLE